MLITLTDYRERVKQQRGGKQRARNYKREVVSIPQDLNQYLLRVPDRLRGYDKGVTKCSRCTAEDIVKLYCGRQNNGLQTCPCHTL